jgi:nucleoside-diphosphate-sugar epimerase
VPRVLVTGGAGYIGSVLTRKLVEGGFQVTVLDNLTYTDIGLRDLKSDARLRLVVGDIRDGAAVREAVAGADALVHLAAVANDPSGELDPRLTEEVNLLSYPGLLKEARAAGVSRFLNASTFGVYGKRDDLILTEDEPLFPLKAYSACKAKSEELVRAASGPGFAALSLRCATVCGFSPRLRLDLIVNTLTAYALARGRLVVWGGEQQRPQIHVEDLTDYFVALLGVRAERIDGRVYNAGAENVSILQIAHIIREALGGALEIEAAPARDDERTYRVSSQRLAAELGLVPRRTVRDAVNDLIAAFRAGLFSDPEGELHHNVARMKALGLDQEARYFA